MKTTNNIQQVDGNHYERLNIEPVIVMSTYNLDWFQGEILKYISGYKFKRGLTDLRKAKHVSRMARELRGDFNYLGSDKEVKFNPPSWEPELVSLYVSQFRLLNYFNEPTTYKYFSQCVVAILNYNMIEVYRMINHIIYLEYEEKED